MDFKSFKFDWHKLQRLASPQAAADLNAFLEKMPQMAGQTILIAAGIAWASAGALGLFTTMQVKGLVELRAKLQETEALLPPVPKIQDVPVPKTDVEAFVNGMKDYYKSIDLKSNGSTITISSKSTAGFSEFREAIAHVQNGGQGWRVNIDRFCVGRECQTFQLAAALKINKVSVVETRADAGAGSSADQK